MENATSKFYNSKSATECTLQCPTECNTINFVQSIALARYPSKWLISQSGESRIDPADRLIVNIYFSQMSYTLIEETPAMTVDQLLALIGGSLGLFLGVSFLTLVEAVEFIYYSCLYCFIRKRNSRLKHREKFPVKKETNENNLIIFV